MTVQRRTIYDILATAQDHPTAADIIERLKAGGHNFAYATVYNTLKYLTEEGLVHELKLEGDASRYDARTEDHQHIVCTSCGKVDEVFAETPSDWLLTISKQTGYEITKEQILFKGVCEECLSATKSIH
ncbi:Fur family peroxide stress response transcriptional regulator [Cohnella lupini]|uniref:Fur family peroxide stress response transcriptional regulator n=2 Tax=Cohnella lupini TaxID=1294267 RepID=A0A3D9ITB7_9BACL|nr:Fur family peroxide stress response transcriptional regulator [Cohnella lupini]